MHRSTRSLLMIALSMFIGILPTATPTTARTPSQISTPAAQSPAPADSATPLSRRCGRVTPPGQPEPACCISGIVFIDGSPVAGATVEIQNSHGDATTMITQVYSGTETRPFYAISLSAAPLNVVENDVITVTAKYSGHEKSISYKVQPGSQQIDIALPRMPDDNYVFARQIRGQAASGRLNQPSRIAADGNGSIYVIDGDNYRIQVFDRNGQFLRQWGTRGTLPGQFDFGGIVSGIAIDPTGNIYVADAGNHRVQKFSGNGNWLLSWGGFGENQGQFNYPSGISVDRNGKVYVADSGNSRIQIFSSTGTWLNAWGTGYPSDVAVDSSGHVYVVNYTDILKYSTSGTLLAILTESTYVYSPFAVTVDRDDNIYVVDTDYAQILKFSSAGMRLATWGAYGTANGEMNHPRGIGADSNGDVFVADTGNDRIQRFDPNGQWLVTWGSVGSTLSRLVNPGQVSVDQNGNVYVIDATTRVQKFSNNGVWLAFIGASGSGPGQLSAPSSLAFDSNGNIYILDAGNNQIQKFSANGAYLTAWGTSGSGPGQFNAPNDISIDASDNIYVADTGNDRVEKFSANGTYVTDWGTSGGAPNGISIDAGGNVYVLDGGNSQVEKFSAIGTYLTAWAVFNNDPGQDYYANGIAVDLNGDVYVVDAVMAKVQKFTGDGQPLAAWGCYGTAIGCFNFGDYGPYVADVAVDAAGQVYITDGRNNRIQVFRPLTITKPISTITHVSSASLSQDDTLVMTSMGQVSDTAESITDYAWTSDKDGAIGSGDRLSKSASQLSPGTHHISLKVRDTQGQWSDPVTENVFVASSSQTTWTMLLYLDGDDDDGGALLDDFTNRLDALEDKDHGLLNPYVRIAAQIDGPGENDTRRVLITPGTANSPPSVVEDPNIGEQAMDTPEALAAFLRWGQTAFHAEHYYLAIADHGQGIQGIGWDSTSDRHDGGLVDSAYLTTRELGQALSADGVAPIDILHLDACSMNLLEVAYEVRERAKILIASQYLGWSYFAYNDYQHAIGATTSPADVAKGIVDIYANLASARPFTIAALNLARAEPAAQAVSNLATELRALVDNDPKNETALATIWSHSRKIESNGDFQNNDLDIYLDLLDWSTKVQLGIDSPAVKDDAAALIAELTGPQPFILRSIARSNPLPSAYGGHYVDLTNSNGISIFYPQRQGSAAFKAYVTDSTFSFTSAYQARWKRFLQGVSVLAGPGIPLTSLPGPLAPLQDARNIFLPLVQR